MRPSNPRGKNPHRAADSRPRKPAYTHPRPAPVAPRETHPERPRRSAAPRRERGEGWIYGRHAVAAALANPLRHWHRLAVLPGEAEEAAGMVAASLAERRASSAAAEPVEVLDRGALETLLPEGAVHEGWALRVEPLDSADLDDVLRAAEVTPGRSVVVVLDRVADPHNVGAILRSAAAFGAAAVVLPEHGAPPQTGALAKAASGAMDRVPLVRAVNLARTLDRLKAAGYWCCGLDESAAAPLAGLDLGPRVALVLGSEGGGLRRLVRERCDYLARVPTRPDLPSLNVSNSAAIALYELARDAGWD